MYIGKKNIIKWFSLLLVIVSLSTMITPGRVSAQNPSANEETEEFNALWISYLEFNDRLKDPATGKLGFTEERFKATVNEMFDNAVNLKMNAVVVHVRPFADAMYPSEIFPWSKYISGTQGKDPGYDPLQYMVEAAHERGLQFHAWINPFRVTNNTTDVKTLAKNHPARKWLTNDNEFDDRYVLKYDGKLYLNPAAIYVQILIEEGIEEIVRNYEVDGIHFDDYFYPNLGKNYKKNFDYLEYQEHVEWCIENDVKVISIADWRRENINQLVSDVYYVIKAIDDSVEFGISPGGFLDNLMLDDRYYVDVKTWLSEPGYIDYICPQIYWTFSNKTYPYDKTLDRWLALRTNPEVKMYVGIAAYKAGSDLEPDWKNDPNVLKKQVEYGRKTGLVDGYIYFRYDFFYKKATQKGITKLLKIL